MTCLVGWVSGFMGYMVGSKDCSGSRMVDALMMACSSLFARM